MESGIIVYESLDAEQQERYSEVVRVGVPVDEHLAYILDGEYDEQIANDGA